MEERVERKNDVLLKTKGLGYWYDNNKKILNNIDMEFEKGKFYSIVGSSGSGKTTLLSLIAGLDQVKEGDIFLGDNNIKNIGLDNYRNKHVSIIFQGYNLMNYMTTLQNITSAMSIKKLKRKIIRNLLWI